MPKKFYGLDWLDDSDPTQLQWAQKYLKERGFECNSPAYLAPLKLRELGQKMESETYGKIILERMKNNRRKNKSRQNTERKVYYFSLPPTKKEELDSLAKKNKQNSTDFLIQLITDTSSLYVNLKKDIEATKNQRKLEKIESKNEIDQYKQISELAIQLLNEKIAEYCTIEILLRDSGIAKDSITDKQALEAEEAAKANTAEAKAHIDKKNRSLSSFHNIKSPMGRPGSRAIYTQKKTADKEKISGTTVHSEDPGTLKAELEAEYSRYEEMLKKARAATEHERKRADDLAQQLEAYKRAQQHLTQTVPPQIKPLEQTIQASYEQKIGEDDLVQQGPGGWYSTEPTSGADTTPEATSTPLITSKDSHLSPKPSSSGTPYPDAPRDLDFPKGRKRAFEPTNLNAPRPQKSLQTATVPEGRTKKE